MAIDKLTPQERRDKLVEAFTYRVQLSTEGNEKKKAAGRKALQKLTLLHPDLAVELGLSVVPRPVSRVLKFRCLTEPVVLDRPEWMDAARLQMTLAHDLYNRCVESCNAIYALIRAELQQGDAFRSYLALEDELSDAYSRKGRLYFEAREQQKTPELRALESMLRSLQAKARSGSLTPDEIAAVDNEAASLRATRESMLATPEYLETLATITRLKNAKASLYEAVSAELKAFQKSDLRRQIGTGQNKGGLLYEATYQWYSVFTEKGLYKPSPTINEVRLAFLATLKDPLVLCRKSNGVYRPLRGRYGDSQGNMPPTIAEYRRWNGAGQFGVEITNAMSGSGDKQVPNPDRTIKSVTNGTNSCFRLRPMVAADLARFPIKQKIDLSRKSSERFHIAEIAVVGPRKAGQTLFASVLFILHRPLPNDGVFISANCSVTKEGGRKVVSLLVTVNLPPKEVVKTGVEAVIRKVVEEGKQTWSVSRSDVTDFTSWLQERNHLQYGWLGTDGTLKSNSYIATANARSTKLMAVAGDYADSAIASLKEISQSLPSLGYLTLPTTFTADVSVKTDPAITRRSQTKRSTVCSNDTA